MSVRGGWKTTFIYLWHCKYIRIHIIAYHPSFSMSGTEFEDLASFMADCFWDPVRSWGIGGSEKCHDTSAPWLAQSFCWPCGENLCPGQKECNLADWRAGSCAQKIQKHWRNRFHFELWFIPTFDIASLFTCQDWSQSLVLLQMWPFLRNRQQPARTAGGSRRSDATERRRRAGFSVDAGVSSWMILKKTRCFWNFCFALG